MARARKVRMVVKGPPSTADGIGPEVPDPLFSHAVLSALEQLVADQLPEWDVPHQLGLLYQRGRTPVGRGDLHGVYLEWSPLPEATPHLMRSERPHHVLLDLAEMFAALPADARERMVPYELMAVGLFTESWMLVANDDEPAERERVARLAEARQLHEAPDRVEAKMFQAVDVNGVRYSYFYPRSKPAVSLVGLSGQNGAGGDVPNALHYLLLTFQGHDLPPWSEWWQAHHDYRLADGR